MNAFIVAVVLIAITSPIASCAANTDARVVATIEGRVMTDVVAFNDIRVLLNDGSRVTYLRSDGSFTFPGVPPGNHVVKVASPSHIFPLVHVDVNSKGRVRARLRDVVSSTSTAAPYPLEFRTATTAQYFEPRESVNIFSMLKNPMVLMMIVMGGLAFIMPKMIEGMDEDELKQMREQSPMASLTGNNGANGNNPVENIDVAGWMAKQFGGGTTKQSRR